MKRQASVVAIGCFTHSWHKRLVVEESVHRLIENDWPLVQLLQRKLTEHGQRLPKLLPRGALVDTVAWRGRTTRGRDVIITTGCTRDAQLATRVRTQRPTRSQS